MKIVLIEKDIDVMGGVERIVNTLANSLSNDNEIYVISEHKNKVKPFFEYNEKVQIKYLLDRVKRGKFNKNKESLFDRVLNRLQKYQDKFITYYLNKETKSILKDADWIIFGRVQVAVHFLPYLVKKKYKAKIIVRDAIHLMFMDSSIKKQMLKYFPNYVSSFIVSSDESIKCYQDFFGNSKINVQKIYNPLGIVPKGEYNIDKKTIVSLGRIEFQKGYENLVTAFSLISRKYPDWKLKIYGSGPKEDALKVLIDEKELTDKVAILPSSSNITEVLNNASIFVTTSRYEGYANMLVEAMSCKMPVISFDWLMGCSDIIKNNENGIIVPLKNRFDYLKGINNEVDVRNLAKSLENLITNPKKCAKLASKAGEIIKTRDKNIIIEQWQKIIKEEGVNK